MIHGDATMKDESPQTRTQLRAALGYYDDQQWAAIVGVTVKTYQNRRSRGDAAPSAKVGKDHLTRIDDLKRWIARRTARKVAA
jgi:hypothetical protein